MSFFEKSLRTLELPAVLEMLAAEAVSSSAKESAAALQPSPDAAEVRRRIAETSAAKEMMIVKGAPHFSEMSNVKDLLYRADLGGSLNNIELMRVASVLRTARSVHSYIADRKVGETSCIDVYFHTLRGNKYLEDRICNSILSEEEIADTASTELTNIRRLKRAAAARVRDSLQKIISSPSYQKALQEPIITMRSDRYVVPVKADHKSEIPGLVHDISSTGMTLFIEPMGAVKANNELRELSAKEKKEIERILAELSAECAEHRDDISADFDMLVKLDFIFAKAKLSYKLNCCEAVITEHSINILRGRHPLLDQAKAVPVSLEIGSEYDTLVITGPNTGGKTVSLKTIGLLSVMNQCGLHVPASDGTGFPVFDKVFADIGDEQSIEQSLSTFSSHMTNIVSILDECTENSLVLFDELGAGTDPTEGAALAISIIEHVRKQGALVAATTHYAELKVYATNEPKVQNASCEFDVMTLRPTYRLLVGIPGKSNAFAISKRLGLDESIINDASARIGQDSTVFENTIEKLEMTRIKLENELAEIEKNKRKSADEAEKAAFLRAQLQVRLEKADLKSKRDAEQIINDARRKAEEVFEELDEMRRRANEEENIQELNRARTELRHQLNLYSDNLAEKTVKSDANAEEEDPNAVINVGDKVILKSMNIVAEVLSIDPDGGYNLSAGIMKVKAKRDEIKPAGSNRSQKKKTTAAATTQLRVQATDTSVDLRGMESIEAIAVAEQFIDNSVMAKLKQVTIVHGKGTGALRNAVQQMLRKNKHVKSFRLGRYGEGETGVTIVELK